MKLRTILTPTMKRVPRFKRSRVEPKSTSSNDSSIAPVSGRLKMMGNQSSVGRISKVATSIN
jgi:hypothetical protein